MVVAVTEIILIPVTADLRSARPTRDGKLARDNVELWYGRVGEVETVATTRGEALRSIAAGLEANSGGRRDALQTVGGDGEDERRWSV